MRFHSVPDRWSIFLAAAWLAWLCAASPAHAATPASAAESGHIDVRDVDAAGLLQAVADTANINLVAGVPPGERRVSFSARYTSVDELFGQLSTALDLQLTVRGRVVVMHPRCDRGTVRVAPLRLPEPVSLNFQKLPLQRLLELFDLKPFAREPEAETLLRSLLVVRVKNLPGDELVQALALALGFDAARDAQGGVAVSASGPAGCRQAQVAALPLVPLSAVSGRLGGASSAYCPYRAPRPGERTRRCEPLEFFALTSLMMRGHLEWSGRWWAFVESPDGLLHSLAVGDYMGRDFGRIKSIHPDGLVLREIIPDAKGVWTEVTTPVKRGVKTVLPRDRLVMFYIEDDSPQGLYNKAVNDLFAFSELTLATSALCHRQFPHTASAVEQATAQWRQRNAAHLAAIERHAEAYAGRVAQDYEVPQPRAMALARDNNAKAQSRSFSSLGPPGSDAAKAHCEGHLAKLQGTALDLPGRFSSELQLLATCQEARTCFNLLPP